MRQDAVIETDDEDRAEFESFCGMEGEQGGRVGIGDRILIGDEGDVFEEVIECARGIFFGEAFEFDPVRFGLAYKAVMCLGNP